MSIDDRCLLALAAQRQQRFAEGDPIAWQERLLARLLRRGVGTAFGRTHDFRSIRSARDFLTRVPATSYDALRASINAILEGRANVLFPGRPLCFGLTTGTEGQPKLIPLNRAQLRSSRCSTVDAALLGGLRHGSMMWHRGKVLYLGPRKGRTLGRWMVFAEGTAFAYRQARPLRARFLPRYEDLPDPGQPQDWAFLERLARQYRIGVVAGNPLEIVAFVAATRALMPEVQLVFNCGYWCMDHLHVYKQAFPNAEVVDVFASNEGTFGLPISPGHFLLNYRRVFFGFVPLEGKEEPIALADTVQGQPYHLCVTTPGGLWNYLTGDAVELVGTRPPTIRLCGRTGRWLSLARERVTEGEVVEAVRAAGVSASQYWVETGERGYVLHLPGGAADAEAVDRQLRRINPRYGALRDCGQVEGLQVDSRPARSPETAKPMRIVTAAACVGKDRSAMPHR